MKTNRTNRKYKRNEIHALHLSMAVMLFKIDEWFMGKNLAGFSWPSTFGRFKTKQIETSDGALVEVNPAGWKINLNPVKSKEKSMNLSMLFQKSDSHGEIWNPKKIQIDIDYIPTCRKLSFRVDDTWNIYPLNLAAASLNKKSF